jgi:hypothetical protein
LRIKSIVGLTTLVAVSTIPKLAIDKLKDFKKRTSWFEITGKPMASSGPTKSAGDRDEILLSLVRQDTTRVPAGALLTKTSSFRPAASCSF